MFFKKAQMDETERQRYAAEINALINADRSAEAYAKTCELEKLDRDAAGYFMAYFYNLGENVKENQKEALRRIEGYVRRVPNDGDGYYLMGVITQILGDNEKAANAYEKAISLGNKGALTLLASLYKMAADAARNRVSTTLNVREYAAGNATAISMWIKSMSLYNRAFEADPTLLSEVEWQGYGRAADMMYALSLNGEVKKLDKADVANAGMLVIGASVTKGKKDLATQQIWRDNAVRVTAQMEQAGFAVMAEYFRLSFCTADCAKNADMILNAKWHRDRITDLDETLTAEQRQSYPEAFDDFLQSYDKQLRRHERALQKDLRANKSPNLALDYLPDRVPNVGHNIPYVKYLTDLLSGAAPSAAEEQPKKKKGFLGLFG